METSLCSQSPYRKQITPFVAAAILAASLAATSPAQAKVTQGERNAQNIVELPAPQAQFLATRTAKIENLACSATTLSARTVSLAEHCLDPAQQFKGPGNSWYYVAKQPLTVKTGRLINHMKKRGTIKSLLVPAATNNDTDIVIGSYGRNPRPGLSAYRRQQLPADQLPTLFTADKTSIYTAGFPADQPNNFGWLSRQIFAGNATGLRSTEFTVGSQTWNVPSLAASFAPTGDGAIPDQGMSGAAAISGGSKPQIIGTASSFNSAAGELNITYNTSGLDQANGARVLHVVRSRSQVPGLN